MEQVYLVDKFHYGEVIDEKLFVVAHAQGLENPAAAYTYPVHRFRKEDIPDNSLCSIRSDGESLDCVPARLATPEEVETLNNNKEKFKAEQQAKINKTEYEKYLELKKKYEP